MTRLKNIIEEFRYFFAEITKILFRGSRYFYLWMGFLTILIIMGFYVYTIQLKHGMVITNMREQVSWGFYIANFTFLVGIAAAAVLLVIPSYLYGFKDIKKVVVFGELLAITAVFMAILFITVDIGRPERLWHALPFVGSLNFPTSILAWDMVVLTGYLILNLFIVTYIGCKTYYGREPSRWIIMPLILLSIPWAVGVHTVTAFVYNGMSARPFWNASILAPRFLASAFCSGPALMIIIFQILRRVMDFRIQDRAIFKVAEIIAYAMAINLFLMLAEIYKEVYSNTIHLTPMRYLYLGLNGHDKLVPWIWASIVMNTIGFLIFLLPRFRKNFITLNIGCVLIFIGIWIEKGIGLIIPGFIPDALGEIYEYMPSHKEVMISLGIWAMGAMVYTLLVRTVISLDSGRLRHPSAPPVIPVREEIITAWDIMQSNVISVTPETSIEEVARLLHSNKISGVPVVDNENRIIGVVTELDIIFNEISREPGMVERLRTFFVPEDYMKKRQAMTAGEIMTTPPITAKRYTPLRDLIQIITNSRIKRVFIVDEEGRPVGVVSRIDIIRGLEGGHLL